MKSLVVQIFHRNPLLARVGSAFLLLSVILLVMIPFNETSVLGINSLIKPFKFATSIWIYMWTMAYLMHYFQNQRINKRLTYLIVITMLYEQVVITVQALRGTLSHFNRDTALEGILFGLMGIMITAMTLYSLYAVLKFRKQKGPMSLTKAQKESIIYGTIIFVVAGFIGGVMGNFSSHNIGGPMGGEGLPLVDWSTKFGDLRISHFIGLHALQILPLLSFGFRRWGMDKIHSLRLVRVIAFFYLLFVVGTFVQAMMGLPLFAM